MKSTFLVFAVSLLPLTATAAIKNPLPIKKGIYVTESASCESPAAADTYGYYGHAFGAGHSPCIFKIVKAGLPGVYNSVLTCTDLPSGKSANYKTTFVVLSDSRLVIANDVGSPTVVRWCAESVNN